jgi:hypothetical protein
MLSGPNGKLEIPSCLNKLPAEPVTQRAGYLLPQVIFLPIDQNPCKTAATLCHPLLKIGIAHSFYPAFVRSLTSNPIHIEGAVTVLLRITREA